MEVVTEIQQGYKKTKIGWIPEDWEIKQMDDVATLLGGFAFKSNLMQANKAKYQVVKMSNVYQGFLSLERTPSFLENITDKEKKYILKDGDIIMSLTGTIGKRDYGYAAVISDHQNLLLNQRLCKYSATKISDQSFLLYLLKSSRFLYYFFMIGRGGTGNQANVGTNEIKQIEVALPPLSEQQKIAKILSTWDKAIKQSQKLIEQLNNRKKGLMQHLLTGKTRLKGFSGEWKEVKLSDVATRLTAKNEELNDNVVTISAQRGFVRQEDFFKKRVASDTLSGYYLIKKGQFAYNKSYSNGYPMGAFKRLDTLDKAVVTTLYICFELKDNVDSDFILDYFEAGLMIRNLMKIAQEGGRAHGLLNIALNDFFSLKMTIPSIVEQQAIAKVLTTADKEIKTQETYLQQLQDQKKGLMQQLLTGQKRVRT